MPCMHVVDEASELLRCRYARADRVSYEPTHVWEDDQRECTEPQLLCGRLFLDIHKTIESFGGIYSTANLQLRTNSDQ
eukprot:92169-Pleurochrysis_carterae.AAC.2